MLTDGLKGNLSVVAAQGTGRHLLYGGHLTGLSAGRTGTCVWPGKAMRHQAGKKSELKNWDQGRSPVQVMAGGGSGTQQGRDHVASQHPAVTLGWPGDSPIPAKPWRRLLVYFWSPCKSPQGPSSGIGIGPDPKLEGFQETQLGKNRNEHAQGSESGPSTSF